MEIPLYFERRYSRYYVAEVVWTPPIPGQYGVRAEATVDGGLAMSPIIRVHAVEPEAIQKPPMQRLGMAWITPTPLSLPTLVSPTPGVTPTITPTLLPCLRAKFVADVTVPERRLLPLGGGVRCCLRFGGPDAGAGLRPSARHGATGSDGGCFRHVDGTSGPRDISRKLQIAQC